MVAKMVTQKDTPNSTLTSVRNIRPTMLITIPVTKQKTVSILLKLSVIPVYTLQVMRCRKTL